MKTDKLNTYARQTTGTVSQQSEEDDFFRIKFLRGETETVDDTSDVHKTNIIIILPKPKSPSS